MDQEIFNETAGRAWYMGRINESKRAEPSVPITDPAFAYRPAVATDVRITWRRFGWTPKEK